jgi:hypothetical protein
MLDFEFENYFDDGGFTDIATGWTVNGAVFWYTPNNIVIEYPPCI